jgi:hypothetical protein
MAFDKSAYVPWYKIAREILGTDLVKSAPTEDEVTKWAEFDSTVKRRGWDSHIRSHQSVSKKGLGLLPVQVQSVSPNQ